jgi:hypothetical protein
MPMVKVIVKLLEPELKPDYVEKIRKIMENETPIYVGSVEELNKRYLDGIK